MEQRFEILRLLFTLVKDDARPLEFPCFARDFILRLPYDWTLIHQHLLAMTADGWVYTEQRDKLVVFLTQAGWEQVESLMAQ